MSVPTRPDADLALDLRRVTVVTPRGRFDLAVPASVPLAYLVPTVLRQAGDQLVDLGAAHGGWVLQRLGAAPFDTAASPASLGIADGELLYLQPRRGEIPTPVFDDAADAIGTTLAERTRPWDAAAGRAAGLAAAVAMLAAAPLAALLAGGPPAGRAIALGISAFILMCAGTLVSRSAGDRAAAAALCCAAVGNGGVAGYLGILALPGGETGPALAAGSAVGLLLCALAFAAAGAAAPEPAAAALACISGLAAGGAAVWAGHGSAGSATTAQSAAAATALVAAFLAVPFIPTFAYRAARLPKPFLPTTAEQLRAGESATPAEILAARTLRADHYITSLIAGCALVTVVSGRFLGETGGWAAPTLAGLACLLAGLRTRTLRGFGQRICLTACAIVIAVELVVGQAGHYRSAAAGAAAVAAAALVAIPAAISAARAGGSTEGGAAWQVAPPVARLLDLAEGLCALAVVPVALQVAGVYGRLRGLGG